MDNEGGRVKKLSVTRESMNIEHYVANGRVMLRYQSNNYDTHQMLRTLNILCKRRQQKCQLDRHDSG
jgi:hypothetical protein